MPRRLLTDGQVERVASRGAEGVIELIALERPDLDLGVDFESERGRSLREAIEHDLTETLEGLREGAL